MALNLSDLLLVETPSDLAWESGVRVQSPVEVVSSIAA